MLVNPQRAFLFFKEFHRFVNMGFRRINILPVYYTHWTDAQLKILKKEFDKVSKYLNLGNRLDKIYMKNLYVEGETALYNSCLVVDCNGDIYPSSIILSRQFLNLKPLLRLGNILDMSQLSEIRKKDVDIDEYIRKFTPALQLSSTYRVDGMLDCFLSTLKKY